MILADNDHSKKAAKHHYFAIFHVGAIYYLPHFLPVAEEMKSRGLSCAWRINEDCRTIADKLGLDVVQEPSGDVFTADYFIFGNDHSSVAATKSKSVLIYHGIGAKSCYYSEKLAKFAVRFVEGEYRRRLLDLRSPCREQERPVVGFSKLDPMVNFSDDERKVLLTSLGLEQEKKTILYAPTFFPSSIELMGNNFPEDCCDFNIIVKPHQFTYARKYKKQLTKLQNWSKSSNVYLAQPSEYNILPFYSVSDVLISDESSALFEFAALAKPVIRNRFVKTRFFYKLLPSRLAKRLDNDINRFSDVYMDSFSYKETLLYIKDVTWFNATKIEKVKLQISELLGELDGKASKRIVDFLIGRMNRRVSDSCHAE